MWLSIRLKLPDVLNNQSLWRGEPQITVWGTLPTQSSTEFKKWKDLILRNDELWGMIEKRGTSIYINDEFCLLSK